MSLGIDASNIRAGGGITHLSRLLDSDAPLENGFRSVIVWGGQRPLAELPDKPWLEKDHQTILDRSLPFREAWRHLRFPLLLQKAGCDVLLAPGGILPYRVNLPAVVISQNLLPFQVSEMKRYPLLSFMRHKMQLVRRAQIRSMEKATGLIFLSEFARATVLAQLEKQPRLAVTIPHGIEKRYFCGPRNSEQFSLSRPFRFVYVSKIDLYKHQCRIAVSVASLRKKGYPIALDLIGPGYPPALRRLDRIIRDVDPEKKTIRYLGPSPFSEMHRVYQRADGLVFASTCENLPNILLEGMAAGLPIACSDNGPMPEVLGEGGVYFSLDSPDTIEAALQKIFENHALRSRIAAEAYQRSKKYSWEKCARHTFRFLSEVGGIGADQRV